MIHFSCYYREDICMICYCITEVTTFLVSDYNLFAAYWPTNKPVPNILSFSQEDSHNFNFSLLCCNNEQSYSLIGLKQQRFIFLVHFTFSLQLNCGSSLAPTVTEYLLTGDLWVTIKKNRNNSKAWQIEYQFLIFHQKVITFNCLKQVIRAHFNPKG